MALCVYRRFFLKILPAVLLLLLIVAGCSTEVGASHSSSSSSSLSSASAANGADGDWNPEFLAPLENLTVTQGRDVSFTCVVNALGNYRVSV